ncbi:hypothetical protein [Mycobacteroides chelonae]|uniref:hypothetical protein n=1 Tax=Mycobacteroides chelonae TaxID=1774 RepID=UPI0018B0398D|nr:hypothetical protein [Mycobacteroides chelonae]MBF9326024.1 hypothetical protein [Mycobacteroides chelonae]MBF9420200.1 hypothetical protein [Mycobacteroides chelonae]
MLDEAELHVAALSADVLKDHMRWIEDHDIAISGSPIGIDDNELTVMLMSELVVNPIKCGLDSLYVACTSLRDLKYVRGIGHPTLVRSSITSSTTSLWMLDEDALIRRTRALKIAYAQCKAELTYTEDAALNSPSSSSGKAAIVRQLEDRRDVAAADADRLGVNEPIKNKERDSEIVRVGADRIPSAFLGESQTGYLVVAEWRLLSGLAHGFHWPARHASPPRPSEDSRYYVVDTALPPRRLLDSVRVAMIAARIAMDRYAEFAGFREVDVRKPWELKPDPPR